MLIQLACDYYSLEEAMKILDKISDEIDIIEIGTDLMLAEGVRAVKTIKNLYPNKIVLADMKVMDGGRELGELAFDNGADIYTVLGVAPLETIQAACNVAREYNKKVCVDMIGVTDQLTKAKEYINMGADYLCVHTADDQLGNVTYYHHLADYVKTVGPQYCSIAGGMNPQNVKDIREYDPEIIVVGGYITKAVDPLKAVREIKGAFYGK